MSKIPTYNYDESANFNHDYSKNQLKNQSPHIICEVDPWALKLSSYVLMSKDQNKTFD